MNFSKAKFATVTSFIAFTVTACGGGGGGGSEAMSRSYSELNLDAGQLAERVEAVGAYNEATGEVENSTLMAELPTSGTASYSGFSGIWAGDTDSQAENNMLANIDTPDVISELNLTADFNTSSISGQMDNFQASADDVQVSGSVNIVNGTFISGPSGEAGMEADLDGVLVVTEAGMAETVGVAGGAAGAFLGDNAEVVTGVSGGDLLAASGNGAFIGLWAAEQR